MNRRTLLLFNTIINYLGFFVSFGVVFFMTPAIVHAVGKEDFGLWNFIFSILGFWAILDMGIAVSVVKFVAENKGAQDPEARNKMVGTFFTVYLIMALIVAVGLAILGCFLGKIFSIPVQQQDKALILFFVLGLRSVVFNFPLSTFRGVLIGEQKMYLVRLITMLSAVGYAATSWVSLRHGYGVIALAWWNLAFMLVEHVAYVIFSFLLVKDFRVSITFCSFKKFKEIASFSLAQLVIDTAGLIRLRSDPIVIQCFLSLPAVAAYSIAMKIAEYVYLLTKQFANALSPVISELHGKREVEKIRTVLTLGSKYTFGLAAVPSVCIYVFAKELIVLWVGESFADTAIVLKILILAVAISLGQEICQVVFALTGHHKAAARLTIIGACANLALSAVLVVTPLKLAGVAWGTLISTFVVEFCILVQMTYSQYEMTYWDFTKKVIIPVALPTFFQFVVTVYMKQIFPPVSFWHLSVACLPGIAIFTGIFLFLSREEFQTGVLQNILKMRSN